jgi:PKD repeat protein
LEADTAYYTLVVLPFPAANYTQLINNQTVTFTNSSTNATSYLWDFGDGMTSTEASPVHTYISAQTYTVKLTASNQCSSTTKTGFVVLTTKVQELTSDYKLNILPNPSSGDFSVQLESPRTEDVQLNLFNAQGALLKTITGVSKPGLNTFPFEGLHLSKGMYQLKVVTEGGTKSSLITVQ